jgi:uncharacterized protein (TIGR02265 family)
MTSFNEPDWDAPLDAEAHIRAIPPGAVIKGMYPAFVAAEAKRRNLALPHGGDKYLPFLDYPLPNHAQLLVEACRLFFPEMPLRRSLRKVGRGAISAFLGSTLGKAVLAGFTQPETVLRALSTMTRAYPTSFGKPNPQLEVRGEDETSCRITLSDFWLFVDSHQIGILEGVFRACGVRSTMRVALHGPASIEMECRWELDPNPRPSFF